MLRDDRIWIGQGEKSCNLLLNQANRHGLIAGASGTGKTGTLKVMAEGFSDAAVGFHKLLNGDEAIARFLPFRDDLRKRVEVLAAIPSAVVHEYHAAWPHVVGAVLHYTLHAGLFPVEGVVRPEEGDGHGAL